MVGVSMKIKRWLDELILEHAGPKGRPSNAVLRARLAYALGRKPHQLDYLLRHEKASGARPVKPAPRGREERQRRKLEARLREQARQGYMP